MRDGEENSVQYVGSNSEDGKRGAKSGETPSFMEKKGAADNVSVHL